MTLTEKKIKARELTTNSWRLICCMREAARIGQWEGLIVFSIQLIQVRKDMNILAVIPVRKTDAYGIVNEQVKDVHGNVIAQSRVLL